MNLEESKQFYSSRRDKVVTVIIEKSRIRMLWLDTSVLIDFAKIQLRENTEPVRARHLTRLRSVVRRVLDYKDRSHSSTCFASR
jgi:hypothetical protein